MNILTVEDETAVAQLLALVLGGPNCKVTTAGNGEKALAKIAAAKSPFDLVITDHRMPRMSGLELVRQLRAKEFGGEDRRPIGTPGRDQHQSLPGTAR